jgi:predicted RNA binding protein YcfA (HicA-like mRNA interferase family)
VPELPNCTGKEAVKALERLGYRVVRQSGSHVRLKYPGRTSLTVPVHHGKDLAKGTLRKIINDSKFSVEEFKAAL